jgi:hypothetical protein
MTVEECAANKNLNDLVEFLQESLAMFTIEAVVPLPRILLCTQCRLPTDGVRGFGGQVVRVGFEVLVAVSYEVLSSGI